MQEIPGIKNKIPEKKKLAKIISGTSNSLFLSWQYS